jgi:drug/metabolite transporter (DMT)-like permease
MTARNKSSGKTLGKTLGFVGLHRRFALTRHRAGRLEPAVQGMLWSAAAGSSFTVLNSVIRALAIQLDPFQAQFLRYLFGLLVMLPWVYRAGLTAFRPQLIGGQFLRGALHTVGLFLWFAALPQIPLADTTAIGFTGPIFIMIGAYLVFKEPMRWERWLAALIGFGGVVIVVWPKLSITGGVMAGATGASAAKDVGLYNLLMLASAPMFAASFLLTKALTRYERTEVIVVWQALTVTLFSLPVAVLHWQAPTLAQWAGFLVSGMLGSIGHYCLTRSFGVADISSTQSVKFLELVWAAFLGWLIFADTPSQSTLMGGAVICASTIWIARREARTPAA